MSRALLAGVVAAAIAAPLASFERARFPIEVPRPGRVVVELDAQALERLGDGGGVEVLDPDGARVDAERSLAGEDTPCRAIAIGEVERDPASWTVALDLGAHPEPHAALVFELEETVLAVGCELEGSEDGREWRTLARGDLFRLGEGTGLARTRLVYAPTRVPKLRLRWPAAAGTPRVRSVEVCAPEPSLAAPVLGISPEPLAAFGEGRRWRLPLPSRAARVRALRAAREPLEARRLERLAWRLELAQDGAWHELASGVWPAGERELRAPLGDVAFLGAALRLEVWGWGGPAPRLEWELAPQRVRFVAARAGRFELRAPALPRPAAVTESPGGEATTVALGAPSLERIRPDGTATLGGAAPERRFAARWRVEAAEDVAPGTPAVLELPSLEGVAASDLSDLRLISGGRLVPARVGIAAEPAVALLASASAPAPGGAGKSRVGLDLGGGRPVALRLRARPEEGAFRRAVSLLGRSGPAPGTPSVALTRVLWECAPDPPRPCEIALRLRGARPHEAALELEDGDASPLRSLDVEVERARAEAVFLWPGGEVELAAGAPGLEAPRYDLAALDAALAVARPVAVRAGQALGADGALERWSRPLLALAVTAAALALLVLLRRLLPAPAGRG